MYMYIENFLRSTPEKIIMIFGNRKVGKVQFYEVISERKYTLSIVVSS